MGALAIINLLAPMFMSIVKNIFPDPEKQAEAEQKMKELLIAAQAEAYKAESIENEAKKDIIVTEMSTSWAGNWRAYLMLVCISMLGFNWMLVPLLNAVLHWAGLVIVPVAIPTELWTLVTVGLGGYIGKETMQTYSNAKVEKARIENPDNDKKFYDVLRTKVFKAGMTQDQVDALQEALRARDGHND